MDMKPIGNLTQQILDQYQDKMEFIKLKAGQDYDWSKGGILLQGKFKSVQLIE